MKIAIQAADLDFQNMGGIRTYLFNILKEIGKLPAGDEFIIYHRNNFNPELIPPDFSNYTLKKIRSPFFWTQLRFAAEVWKDAPDALWMPLHNIPLLRRKSLKTTVTVHDLAFKYFPRHFTGSDLKKLNFLTDIAIRHSDKIIAVSHSTKNDILKFYPQIKEGKIKVIHHGFDPELFQKEIPKEESEKFLKSCQLQATNYILHVGTLQPRKNLEILMDAFEKIKSDSGYAGLKLVLAGGKGWLWDGIIKKAENSPHKKDIILTGTVLFKELTILYRHASIFAFPSLYEGFGLPILEAFASQIPVVCAHNSSLPEVAGDAALYFENNNAQDLAQKIQQVLENPELKKDLIQKGLVQLQKFSWEKCARETLEFLKS